MASNFSSCLKPVVSIFYLAPFFFVEVVPWDILYIAFSQSYSTMACAQRSVQLPQCAHQRAPCAANGARLAWRIAIQRNQRRVHFAVVYIRREYFCHCTARRLGPALCGGQRGSKSSFIQSPRKRQNRALLLRGQIILETIDLAFKSPKKQKEFSEEFQPQPVKWDQIKKINAHYYTNLLIRGHFIM